MVAHRLAPALALAASLAATPAFALGEDECAIDADCGGGLACLEETFELCMAGPGMEPVCETEVVKRCGPKACTSNAQCTGGTACVSFSYEACEGEEPLPGGADPGDAGGDAAGGCETVTESYCVPPWVAPCTVAADCGPGFTCEPELECWGSGGTPRPDDPAQGGGAADDAGETCTPTGVSRCELIPTTCTTDADCATGLGCEDFSDLVCEDVDEPPPLEEEGGTGGDTGGGADDGAGDDEGPTCTEETASYCVPDGFAAWMQAGGAAGYDEESGLGGGQERASGDDDGSGGGSGCQAAGGGLSLLALLGVAFLVRRR